MAHALRDRIAVRAFRLFALLHRPFARRGPDPVHALLPEFVGLVDAGPGTVVLELGARNVTGHTHRHLFPTAGRYIGADIHPGEGVDLVVDAHRLSHSVAAASVDAVFCVSVFEHLAFPWKVALEINKVLKPGGYVYVFTHPMWPAHELPWDFWRFPVAGLASLFNSVTGFEVISAAEGLPCRAYSLVDDPPMRGTHNYDVHGGVAVIARKTGDYDDERLRWDIDIGDVLASEYPRRDPGAPA